ncbi:MAG TPA: DUF885 domain-containing protein [Candidatus Baltobacteraceae bacterium]|nr:DUF885 domain-containing protein [Candidatus Baltobacteraceae bacterium]
MQSIRRILAAVALIGLTGAMPVPSVAGTAGADARFQALAHDFFYWGFKESPVQATAVGVHAYDARLDDMSAAAVARRDATMNAYLAKFEAIHPAALTRDDALDRTLIIDAIRDSLLSSETLQDWKHNPDMYSGLASGSVFLLISREFAPLQTRMRDAIARENAIPAMLEQAKKNIVSVDAMTQQIAAEQAQGGIGFFQQTVPMAFASVKNTALQAQLKSANARAMLALAGYAKWITSLKPQGTFAIGRDAYEKKLQYEDALSMPVEQYLSYGEKALAQTRTQFIATAKEIDPNKTPQQVYASLAKDYPPPTQLLATATNDLKALRAFVISHHIITMPADANIKVIETPPFERAFITAAEDSPGALETVATQAYYYVTPPDPKWPAERTAGFMAQFNNYQFPIISAHEVYPGHFTNFAVARHLKLSLTRKLAGSAEFAEGWAHYSEQMMVDEGWGNGDPKVRLAQLEEALLRECRYVAGVKLHTAGWSVKQAEQLFQTQCFQTPAVALEESMRGTQDPMYGYYTLGKLMILKLREDYKKKLGSAFTLEKFHDALLAHGDPPIPLLRPFILGAADDGQPL